MCYLFKGVFLLFIQCIDVSNHIGHKLGGLTTSVRTVITMKVSRIVTAWT
jgi:hypothetical protein